MRERGRLLRKRLFLFFSTLNYLTPLDSPPLLGERRNPVATPLESQIEKPRVYLLEVATLLSGFGHLALELIDKLKNAPGHANIFDCIEINPDDIDLTPPGEIG